MSYGIIEYDKDGKPICEICKKSFNRVLSHVRQKHDLSEREYKKMFGFDLRKGICSKQSAAKSREKVLDNYDLVVTKNLLKGGQKSRFKKGGKGRTSEQISEMTRLRLIELGKSTILSNSKQRHKPRKPPKSGRI